MRANCKGLTLGASALVSQYVGQYVGQSTLSTQSIKKNYHVIALQMQQHSFFGNLLPLIFKPLVVTSI